MQLYVIAIHLNVNGVFNKEVGFLGGFNFPSLMMQILLFE